MCTGCFLFGIVGVTLGGGFGTLNKVGTAHHMIPAVLLFFFFNCDFSKRFSPHLTYPLRAQWLIRPRFISSSSLCQLLHVWLRSSCSTPVCVFHFQQLITTLSLADQPFFYLRASKSTPSHVCCSCPFVRYVLPISIFLTSHR